MAAGGKNTADLLSQVLHSLFVTNSPSGCNARQILDSCKHYGHIVDAFIPLRLSKAGDKPPTNLQKGQIPNKIHTGMNNKSYASVLNNKVEGENATGGTPMMVIDEECFIDKNMDLTLVAKVKSFKSLPNLRVICNQEGFEDMTIWYLRGFWVALEFKHAHACEQLQNHSGASSWFTSIIPWSKDFTVDERVSWVDIEGVLSVAWTSKTFEKIAQRILVIRAREIIGWNPEFIDEDNENDSHSEGEKMKSQGNEIASESVLGSKNHERENIIWKHVEKNVKTGGNGGYRKEGFGDSRSFVKGSVPNGYKPKMESSLLEKLNDFIEIGQAMGYSMEGCLRNIEELFTEHGVVNGLHFTMNVLSLNIQGIGSKEKNNGLYHSWFIIKGFDSFVKQAWQKDKVDERNSMIYLKKKLQLLKKKLRAWGKDGRKDLEKKRFEIQSEIHEFDNQIDCGCLSASLTSSRASLHKSLLDLDKIRDMELIQKAKLNWAVEGDENSKYFHGVINKRRQQRSIRVVLVNGEWIENPDRVKREFHDHFASSFSNSHATRLLFEGSFPRLLSNEQASSLEAVVTDQEIKNVDACKAIKEFFASGKFPIGCNPLFISLIPKISDAKFVKDFRPISLIGCQYKIVRKILANRLSVVIDILVSSEQSAFIKGRQILDGPMILNEMLCWCNNKKKQTMIFKVDFEKAFDSVRWDYLDDILHKFGFGSRWRGWIAGCLNSCRVTNDEVMRVARLIGCEAAKTPFKYLGVVVGDLLSSVLKKLESLRSSFFRGANDRNKKMTWVSWDKVLANKKNGGLELDPWLEDGPFKCNFPRVYALEENKHVSVGDKLKMGLSASLRRFPRGGAENSQMNNLRHLVNDVVLSDKSNTWIWSLEGSGLFSVTSA
nr:RNA-directed DNA polymerase, eukaryota [Tanacetum cinerariifolium]